MESEAVYPMPLFPRLTVRDVAASTAFYRDVLGFGEVFSMPGGGMSHVRYRTYADVMLAESEEGPPEHAGSGVDIYLTAEDESVDDIAERVRDAGGEPGDPTETPWNTREVTVTDRTATRWCSHSRPPTRTPCRGWRRERRSTPKATRRTSTARATQAATSATDND